MVRSVGDADLPSLDQMRSVLRVGMTRDELLNACNGFLGKHRVRISLPALPETNVVGIHVAEGTRSSASSLGIG